MAYNFYHRIESAKGKECIAVCGEKVNSFNATYFWKDVTCRKCLLKKPLGNKYIGGEKDYQ